MATLTNGAGAPDALAEAAGCPAGRSCLTVTVPLDRSGDVSGKVDLWVERRQAARPTRPPLFVFAKGPGLSATWQFSDEWIDHLFPGVGESRDVVVIDARGTGRSDPLECPELQAKPSTRWTPSDVAACAALLGPRHAFVTTAASAEDVEAVRRRLGEDEIALYGDTSGAQLALEYARRHPERVERLLLRSPRGSGPLDALNRDALRAVPRILSGICRQGRCEKATPDIVGDVTRLAARLEQSPMPGQWIYPSGRPASVALDGYDLLEILAAAELEPQLYAEVPSAVRSALRGDPQPLTRLRYRPNNGVHRPQPSSRYSDATYLAVRCTGSDLPWTAATPSADRLSRAQWLAQRLPQGVFGPFGAVTALRPVVDKCAWWPASAGVPSDDRRPLPDAPALVIAGELSVVAPVETGAQVATALPHGSLLTVPDAGYDVAPGAAKCERVGAGRFLAGEEPTAEQPWTCDERVAIRSVKPFPWTLSDFSATDAEADRGLAAVRRTIQDAFASLNYEARRYGMDPARGVRAGALRGGVYILGRHRPGTDRRVSLEGASAVDGVSIDGEMSPYASDLSRSRGIFVVTGEAGVEGRLTLRDGFLSGWLGGGRVRGELTMDFVDVVGLEWRD